MEVEQINSLKTYPTKETVDIAIIQSEYIVLNFLKFHFLTRMYQNVTTNIFVMLPMAKSAFTIIDARISSNEAIQNKPARSSFAILTFPAK